MKRAFIFVLLSLSIIATSGGDAFAQKRKFKEKRYEPATRSALKEYEGRYVGITASYFIDITFTPDGELSITSYEGEREASLKDIRFNGPILTATKVYTDGGSENFQAVFANRILNGQSAFGLIVDNLNVKLDDLLLTSLFYRLREERAEEHSSFLLETDAARARLEIEARLRELAAAVQNKDFTALQALRTENFSQWTPKGEVLDSEQMAARTSVLLQNIQPPVELSHAIETLILMDNEAIVIVHQKFSRMQPLAGGQLQQIETHLTERETWIQTPQGWKLKFVDNIHDQQTIVDGIKKVMSDE